MPRKDSKYGPIKGNPIAGGSSKYWRDPHAAISTYNAVSLQAEKGLPMRSFKRTKESVLIGAVDSINYLTIVQNYVKVDSVQGSTNGKAAFANIVEDMFNLGYRSAHKKDLESANLTSYKQVCQDCFQLCYEILTRKTLRSLTNSITESSTTSSAYGTLSPWDIDDWDFFLSKIHNFGPIPHWIYTLANQLFSKFIKFSDSYSQYKSVYPPAYGMFWTPLYKLEEVQNIRDALKPERVKTCTLLDKFGIPYDMGINHEVLKPIECSPEDIDIRALFNHLHVDYQYGTTADVAVEPRGDMFSDMTDAYKNRKYFFDDPAPRSMIHALACMLANYDATNNEYGLLEHMTVDVKGAYNAIVAAEDDTSWTKADLNSKYGAHMFLMFLGAYMDGDGLQKDADKYRIAVVGDNGGTPHFEELYHPNWVYAVRDNDLKFGDGVSYAETRTNLMNYLLAIQYNDGGKGVGTGSKND
jgi:hypothetical protein